MQMHVHRQVELFGVGHDLFQAAVPHRVGGVRRQAEARQGIVAMGVAQGQTLLQIAIGIGGIGGGEIHQNQPGGDAHARLCRRLHRGFGEEIHVVEAGDAAPDHLQAGQPRAVAHEILPGMARLGRPDVVIEPVHQRQVVGVPTE